MLIGDGLAFDKLGRELIQVHQTWVSLDNLLVLDKEGRLVREDGCLGDRFKGECGDDCWSLTAHYAEKALGHIKISDPCRCDREEWDRTCETVVYTLQQIDCEQCCRTWKCELECCCPRDAGCCGEHKRKIDEIDRRIAEVSDS